MVGQKATNENSQKHQGLMKQFKDLAKLFCFVFCLLYIPVWSFAASTALSCSSLQIRFIVLERSVKSLAEKTRLRSILKPDYNARLGLAV